MLIFPHFVVFKLFIQLTFSTRGWWHWRFSSRRGPSRRRGASFFPDPSSVIKNNTHLISFVISISNTYVIESRVENVFPMTSWWHSIINNKLSNNFVGRVLTEGNVLSDSSAPSTIPLNPLSHWRSISTRVSSYSSWTYIFSMIKSCFS